MEIHRKAKEAFGIWVIAGLVMLGVAFEMHNIPDIDKVMKWGMIFVGLGLVGITVAKRNLRG